MKRLQNVWSQYRDKRYGVSIDPTDELTISAIKHQEHMTYIFKDHIFVNYYKQIINTIPLQILYMFLIDILHTIDIYFRSRSESQTQEDSHPLLEGHR